MMRRALRRASQPTIAVSSLCTPHVGSVGVHGARKLDLRLRRCAGLSCRLDRVHLQRWGAVDRAELGRDVSCGSSFLMRGVTLLGLRDDLIVWARLYLEPVEQGGGDIDAAVRELYHAPQPRG